jgi:hypothetical protein
MKSYVAISLSDICNLNFEKLLTSLKRRRYYQHDMADIVFPDDYKLITKIFRTYRHPWQRIWMHADDAQAMMVQVIR